MVPVEGAFHGTGNVHHQDEIQLLSLELVLLDSRIKSHRKVSLDFPGKRIFHDGFGVRSAKQLITGLFLAGFEKIVIEQAFEGHVVGHRQIVVLDILTKIADILRAAYRKPQRRGLGARRCRRIEGKRPALQLQTFRLEPGSGLASQAFVQRSPSPRSVRFRDQRLRQLQGIRHLARASGEFGQVQTDQIRAG